MLIFTWVILVSGLVVALGFVESEQSHLRCKEPRILITEDPENNFLERPDIIRLLKDRGDSINGQPMSSVDVTELENVLNSHVAIAKSEVYVSVNGEVSIEVTQRKPVLRVFNYNSESYYIDEEGKLMPLSDKFTAHVPVAMGHIFEPYAHRFNYTMADIVRSEALKEHSLLDDLYALAMFIRKDKFWEAQVEQIYVNSEKELEIIPRVGNHRIILGDASALEEKFMKLRIFYEEGLNTTGWWNNYSVINLKFKDQVVCTKKQ